MGMGIIWIRSKAKTILVNFNKVSLKLAFVKILIASFWIISLKNLKTQSKTELKGHKLCYLGFQK